MATLTIPAAYLEDFRTAVVREISSDSDMLSTNHAGVLTGRYSGDGEDRTLSVQFLRRDMSVLGQVLDAADETTVTAEAETLAGLLEELVRVLAGRLNDEQEYSPIPMGRAGEIAEHLAWASTEAIRLIPALDERAVA